MVDRKRRSFMVMALGLLGASGLASAQNQTGNVTDGNQTGNETAAPTDQEPETHDVQMVTEGTDYYFDPIGLHVQPGDTVRWIIDSGTHSTTAYAEQNPQAQTTRIPDGAEAWNSGTLTQEGAEFTYTFEQEGTYDYYCIPHKTLGMVGRIVCGEPGGPAEQGEIPDSPGSGQMPTSQQIIDQENIPYPFTGTGGNGGTDGGDGGGDGGEVQTAIPGTVKTVGIGVVSLMFASLLGGYVSLRYGRGMNTATAAGILSVLLGVLLILVVVFGLLTA